MSAIIALRRLIAGLTRAFTTAQEELCWEQLSALRDYFHDDGSARTLDVNLRLPAQSGSPESPRLTPWQVPVLGLVAPQPLGISEARLSFKVGITELRAEDEVRPPARSRFLKVGLKDAPRTRETGEALPVELLVDLKPSAGASGIIAVDMKVRSLMLPEGYARLVARLSELQGPVEPEDEAKEGRDSSAAQGP